MNSDEKRCTSTFDLCFRDISETEAWMLTHILIQLLKSRERIHEIYKMLIANGSVQSSDYDDRPIDFALLGAVTNQGSYPAKILQWEGIKTDADLVKFVYEHDPHDKIYRCGQACISSIAAYMNLRGIIPEGNGMADVIGHFVTGIECNNILNIAEAKCARYWYKMRKEKSENV